MRVLFAGGGTGGHLVPALTLADALHDVVPDVEPVIVGAERGIEARLLPDRVPAYRYYLLPTEPIHRRRWWRNVVWVRTAPRLVVRCRAILRRERPRLVVGTGGYAAGPIVWFARRRGLPVALQEQNAYPGFTTRVLAGRANQIHLAYPEARDRLRLGPATEVYSLGNPVAVPSGGPDRAAARAALSIPRDTPVVFVVGGSQGSLAINDTIARVLDAGGFAETVVLWSTGHGTWDRFERYDQPPLRHVRPFWAPISDAYAAADVVIGRAGAMSTAEFVAWGLPAILIPLPTAAADHQTENAKALEAAGAALHIPEASATPRAVEAAVGDLLRDRGRLEGMARAARSRAQPDAARQIALRLARLLNHESLS